MCCTLQRWKELGIAPSLGEPAYALGEAYLQLGAKLSFTCAPYLLDSKPEMGDQIAWGSEFTLMAAVPSRWGRMGHTVERGSQRQ